MSTLYYRTKDGQADYKFSFEQVNDRSWRAYIVEQPSYKGRAEDAHSSHRFSDGSRKYVCWDVPLKTESEAKSVAGLWADSTQEYIKTGKKF